MSLSFQSSQQKFEGSLPNIPMKFIVSSGSVLIRHMVFVCGVDYLTCFHNRLVFVRGSLGDMWRNNSWFWHIMTHLVTPDGEYLQTSTFKRCHKFSIINLVFWKPFLKNQNWFENVIKRTHPSVMLDEKVVDHGRCTDKNLAYFYFFPPFASLSQECCCGLDQTLQVAMYCNSEWFIDYNSRQLTITWIEQLCGILQHFLDLDVTKDKVLLL